MADTCDNITDNSECPDCISIDFNYYTETPSTGDTPLFRITDTYFGPIRACAIVNNLAQWTVRPHPPLKSVGSVTSNYSKA